MTKTKEMIKTKQPQLINAQNGFSDIVYFEAEEITINKIRKTVTIIVISFNQIEKQTQRGETIYTMNIIGRNEVVLNASKFMELYGTETFDVFYNSLNDKLINLIQYVNNYDWDNNDQPMKKHSYWSLTSNDLEAVQN